jgi:hypothetical protein
MPVSPLKPEMFQWIFKFFSNSLFRQVFNIIQGNDHCLFYELLWVHLSTLCGETAQYVWAFAKMRRLHHILLFAWNNSAPAGRIFMKFHMWEFFKKLLRKCKSQSNMTRITGNLHGNLYTFMIYPWILFRMRNVSDKSRRKDQDAYFTCSNPPPPPKIKPLMI